MHTSQDPRRTVYGWAEELGYSASLVGAIAHLRGWSPSKPISLDEFEEISQSLHESLRHGRRG